MKIKKSGKFFKSLRFRILIILIILGIVPSVIVTEMVIANYEDRAIANRVQSMENICELRTWKRRIRSTIFLSGYKR